ncbi:hypothetical protein ANN_26547 [Periplaneta americana]|uniref:RNase H type-1 domain-containing protein n=1 Tax=Periplaneta americana TaxID=6978 RepID=A0ABQ8RYD4_PERAM|nr:hypothetical protein ANN_26547 [Periplaneta americana]
MGNACYYSLEKLLSSSLLSKNLKVRIYKTVILPVVLYGCETWTLTLREEHRLRVFENKVLRKIFGAKRDEVTGEWRKLHNAKLHALYSSPDIIRNIKSRSLRRAGHVAHMGESRNAYRVLVGRPEGKRPLGRPRRRWEDNIKMDLREVGYDDRDWINLAQDRDQWRAYVRAAMNLRVPQKPFVSKGGRGECMVCKQGTYVSVTNKGGLYLEAYLECDKAQNSKLEDEVTVAEGTSTFHTINIRYPPQNWLHLYTDGSLISREQGAGVGVTCCLFSLYRSLGYGTTSFDGEIIAISESLRNPLCHINKFKNAVILSDSKAAILSIVSKHTPSSQTAEITKMLSQLISLNKIIVLQWIPSHYGILGKENTDALAKKGSTATYRPVTKSTYYSVKRFIKPTYLDFNKQNLITQSQGKKWNSLHQNPQLIPDLPRKSSVAAFRLATGHDCLAKQLHRIGIYQSPNCPLCNSNQEMDSEHLKICASVARHDNIFEKYWSARGQMTLLSNAWH